MTTQRKTQDPDFQARLKEAMGDLSNSEVARRSGLSEGAVRNYVVGESLPVLDKVRALAKAVGVSPEWLAFGVEPTFINGVQVAQNLAAVGRASFGVLNTGKVAELMSQATDHAERAELLSRIQELSHLNVSPEDMDLPLSEIIRRGQTGEGTDSEAGLKWEYSPDAKATEFPGFEEYTVIPRRDVFASAGGGYLVTAENMADHVMFKTSYLVQELGLRTKSLTLIQARGDSMEPTLSDGDLLLVDMIQSDIRPDGIYVFVLDDHLMVKRLQFLLTREIEVISDNPRYKPLTIHPRDVKGFRIVGRVVWSGGKL